MRRAVLVAGAVAVASAACGTDAGDDGSADDAIARMVMETCAPRSVAVETQICRCALQELQERFDAEELQDLDRRLRDDPETVPADLQEIVLGCGFAVVAPPTTQRPSTTSTTSSTSTTSTTRSSTTTTTRVP